MNNDIGYTLIDFILNMIVFAAGAAVLVLLGAVGMAAWEIIKRRKKK